MGLGACTGGYGIFALFLDVTGTVLHSLADAELMFGLIQQLSDMGAALREIITLALTDKELYRNFSKSKSPPYRTVLYCNLLLFYIFLVEDSATDFQVQSITNYKMALKSLVTPPIPDEFEGKYPPKNK